MSVNININTIDMSSIVLPSVFEKSNIKICNNFLNNNNDVIKKIDNTDPPFYDGSEPYYIFRRKCNLYLQRKKYNNIYVRILIFINKLLDTNYKNLLSIVKIEASTIPSYKKALQLLSQEETLYRMFETAMDLPISTHKLINIILNKIDFSFIETIDNGIIYYNVKPYKYISK